MHRIVLAFFALIPLTASAQPLVDHVPADAIVYLGWRGSDTLGATYDNSHLAAVLKASKVSDIVDQTIPQIYAKVGENKPEVLAQQQAITPLLKHAWKRPTALYVTVKPNLKTQDITIEVFTCPSGDIEPPDDIPATNLAKLAGWIDAGKSPYIYLGKGMRNTAGAEELVLYERENDHDGDGMNMLFGDGHVEWNNMADAKRIIAASAVAPKK